MMEKQMLIAIGGTLAGIVVGFGAGYWVAQTKLEAVYHEAANLEAADAKAYYKGQYDQRVMELTADNLAKKYETATDESEDVVAAYSEADVKWTEKAMAEMPDEQIRSQYVETEDKDVPTIVEQRPKPPIMNYHRMFKPVPPADEVVPEKTIDDPVDPEEPYDISEELYYAGDDTYRQKQLKYFFETATLTTVDDEPVVHPEVAVGPNIHQLFEDMDPEDSLYIRNPKLKIDFEIVRYNENYAEVVGGLEDM
jgi:hypothetical protein